jgi:tRNA-dihydrouridine synthase B
MFYLEKYEGVCVIKSYSVRNIQINPGLVLSPMSGVTTRPFRRLIKELNPGAVGLVVSEFVSVEGMTRGSQRTLEMMRFAESERPYCVQIFGYDIDRMRDAALMVQDIGADVVDINCGCPAPKVVKRGGGCELMRQPDHLQQIIKAVKTAVSIPVTIKIRAGWDDGSRNALAIAKMAEGEGVEAIAIHGRTRSQLYRGEADWDLVQEIAEVLSIPVLGSGDVVCRKTAEERLKGKVAGLFIGRASMMNPFVFSEILHNEPSRLKGNYALMLDVLFRYIELLREDFPESSCGGKLKQLASQMCRGAQWKKQLLQLNSIADHHALLTAVKEGSWRAPSSVAIDEPEPRNEDASCDQYATV